MVAEVGCWRRLLRQSWPEPGRYLRVLDAGHSQFPDTRTPAWAFGPPGGMKERMRRKAAVEAGDSGARLTTMRFSQGDYENVIPDFSEDEGIHYSELIQFGVGERPQAQENVDYVILKH